MSIRRPPGRPPVPCEKISLVSKRCYKRETHPYPPYRCKCEKKPTKCTQKMYTTNPLCVVERAKPPGRKRVVNWSGNGLPLQFKKLTNVEERKKEKYRVRVLAGQRKHRLFDFTHTGGGRLHAWIPPTLEKRLVALLKANPTTSKTLDRLITSIERIDGQLRLIQPKTKKTRTDPALDSRLGSYWVPGSSKRNPKRKE